MTIEQVIFTSIRSTAMDGYQIAATSNGVSHEETAELTHWCPAHDALGDDGRRATSVNFHQLASGRYCVSRTQIAGEEYSGRGGGQVYTHLLLVDEETLARFAFHPFRIFEAAELANRIVALDDVDETLESFELPGKCSASHGMELARANHNFSSWLLARLVHIAMLDRPTGVVTDLNPHMQMAAVFDLLPINRRAAISFTSGLKPSVQRPVQFMMVPSSDSVDDEMSRDRERSWFDLRSDADDPVDSLDEWPQFIAALLDGGNSAALPRLLKTADSQHDATLTQIIAELHVGLERNIAFAG